MGSRKGVFFLKDVKDLSMQRRTGWRESEGEDNNSERFQTMCGDWIQHVGGRN